MNRTTAKPRAMTLDVDELLQDSYLLVLQLRNGASVLGSEAFKALCIEQVEQVGARLKEADLPQRSIDHISHAQCALLDETLLSCIKGDPKAHAHWASEPLQARFFNRHQAGEFLYEDMREVLREPAPDVQVLTAFHRVLMLGFQGRYREVDDPERLQLLADLSARVAPMHLGRTLITESRNGPGIRLFSRLDTPRYHGLVAGLLMVGVWWGLDQWLGSLIASFSPAQV
ncbi:type VI secretion system protein TssL, short form [Pseudomonas fluorescens]|uniref:type VI secretion system protein TssL, short form n=1 Tax=Pseudomonas fluorescens TaxID=294 RepID=UPI003F96D638